MNKTFVIGHKNPDTDAISSAISYAYLKQKLGFNVEARRIGTLNEETKFALNHFKVEAPDLLSDARCQLKDIDLDEVVEINKNQSCNDAFSEVIKTNNRTLFVTDNHHLEGIVSISDLTSIRLKTKEKREELLSRSNIELIAKDIDGLIITNNQLSTNGRVVIYSNNDEDIKDSIVIVNDEKLITEIDNKKPGLIISALDLKVKTNSSLIYSKMPIEDIVRVIYEAIPLKEIMTTNYVAYKESEYIDDIANKIISTRYRCYPVINEIGEIIGSVSRYHLFNYSNKKFILVDHSSKIQTINNIDQAEILEIVDHHHIGDITTTVPIYYRNQTCGCTCSIIYQMYKENNIIPPKDIAGIMLSAIISDTLYFISHTTTALDVNNAEELAKIANVDLHKYAQELLSASVKLKDADIKDIIKRDLKQYSFNGYKIAVGQTNYSNISEVQSREEEFKSFLAKYQEDKGYHLLIMMFTSVRADGTMFLFFGPKAAAMFDIIETKFDDHSGYDSEIISRKQQLIPALSKVLEQY